MKNKQCKSITARGLMFALVATAWSAQQAHAQERLPLVTFYSASLQDYHTTALPSWTCQYYQACPSHPDIQPIALQGHVYNPNLPQPPNTVPLFHWWSGTHGDNHLTTDTAWGTTVGDRHVERGGEYVLVRIEGYIPASYSLGHIRMYGYRNIATMDHVPLATWRQGPPAGYEQLRYEGALLPPESAALDRCLSNMPHNSIDPVAWQARGNYIDTWGEPAGLFNNDVMKFTAPADRYRIDYWGHEYPVRGYPWSSATSGFPRPGLPPYAMLARITSGRVFVYGRGWFEPYNWFQALGDDYAYPGACILYEESNGLPADIQVSYNDPVLSDNGGWANVRIKQWW